MPIQQSPTPQYTETGTAPFCDPSYNDTTSGKNILGTYQYPFNQYFQGKTDNCWSGYKFVTTNMYYPNLPGWMGDLAASQAKD